MLAFGVITLDLLVFEISRLLCKTGIFGSTNYLFAATLMLLLLGAILGWAFCCHLMSFGFV